VRIHAARSVDHEGNQLTPYLEIFSSSVTYEGSKVMEELSVNGIQHQQLLAYH
jgi:hypothetical protein